MRQLTRKYWHIIWSLFKAQFKWPLLLRTVSISILVFCFLKGFFNWIEQLLTGTFIVALVILTIRQIQINRQIKKAQQESGKKWMFETVISQLGGAMIFIYIPFQLVLQISREWLIRNLNTSLKLSILSVLLVGSGILFYLILFSIPKQLKGHLKIIYPEYSLV